jgi:hypothetical protein
LRGAADANRDGRVTLAEGYQYAFSETLARTTSTQAGPQRPRWEIQLVGTGDLVLTDLRAAAAKLVLDEKIAGRVNVFSGVGGFTVEVTKTAGSSTTVRRSVRPTWHWLPTPLKPSQPSGWWSRHSSRRYVEERSLGRISRRGGPGASSEHWRAAQPRATRQHRLWYFGVRVVTQIGLVNIAKNTSAPIGLVNVITHGRFNGALWASETNVASLALKAGSKHVYGLAQVGLNPRGPLSQPTLAAGLGLGARALFGRWYAELEGVAETFSPFGDGFRGNTLSSSLRLQAGFQLFTALAVYAGAQVSVQVKLAENNVAVNLFSPWGFALSARARLVPGLMVGVQVL